MRKTENIIPNPPFQRPKTMLEDRAMAKHIHALPRSRLGRTANRTFLAGIAATALLCVALSTPIHAASETKPYDEKLFRLSEVLGAVHYLRELCGANEGQYWRERMRELMDAEGSTALRRARLTRAFNQGYRSYSRTYITCSPSAQTAITRFLGEGSEISEGLLKSFP